ncbi:MAG TPA: hypothetical protein VJ553_02420 [Candidatus Paceibacterota bacterium]|nr:hypothetical protein [Candidatus Paceibacterota bacterium]
MENLVSGFIGACIAAAAGLLVAGVVAFIRRRVRLTGPLAETVGAHVKQLAQMRPLVMMLVVVQKPQLLALLCILSAMKDQTNGDFERAYGGVKGALDKFDDTLLGIAGAECEEKKP